VTPKERMLAVLNGEQPDQVPTGELGVDYPSRRLSWDIHVLSS